MKNIRIFDTTLRDGEQTPGVSLSSDRKLAIAKKLETLGVDVIEAGFPRVTHGEMKAIKLITSANLDLDICGLARAHNDDIDAVVDAGLDYAHIFIATSDIHLEYKLKITQEQMLEKAVSAVTYAKSRGLVVEFSAEDATRTDRTLLDKVFSSVAEAGADRIDIPDTVGYSTPKYMAQITQDAIKSSGLPVSVHCHNDFGLAVANSISSIQSGAVCAHVTINGIGERAGNTSLEEFVMALDCLEFEEKYSTNINNKLLYDTSRFVSRYMGIVVQPNKAIVGDNAFGHESGIHTHGVLNNPLTYEPISPELVGRKRWLQIGKHAGLHGMNAMLSEYGITPTSEQSRIILEDVKKIADSGKHLTDVDLLAIATDVMGKDLINNFVQLKELSVSAGTSAMPHAFVKLIVNNKEFVHTAHGVGPVDASLNAIQKIMSKTSQVKIKDYGLASISGGSDALCEVTIQVEDSDGNSSYAKAVGEDIITTSVRAVIDGINHLSLKQNPRVKN